MKANQLVRRLQRNLLRRLKAHRMKRGLKAIRGRRFRQLNPESPLPVMPPPTKPLDNDPFAL